MRGTETAGTDADATFGLSKSGKTAEKCPGAANACDENAGARRSGLHAHRPPVYGFTDLHVVHDGAAVALSRPRRGAVGLRNFDAARRQQRATELRGRVRL